MAPEPVRVSSPMGDFHQGGVITTLHRLGRSDLNRLEGGAAPVRIRAPHRPGSSLSVLRAARASSEGNRRRIAWRSLPRADRGQYSGSDDRADYEEMRALFEGVETRSGHAPVLLWNSGRRVQGLLQALRDEGLDPGSDGKGRAIWLANGYVLASNQARVIAVHDCDILNYSREMLARLCYPTANPNLHYEFAKAYYGRVTDRLNGRVTRLFVGPLLKALKSVLHRH